MIPKEMEKLVVQIAGKINGKKEQDAKTDPEACVMSLLKEINDNYPRPSANLQVTVESAFFVSNQEEARKILKRQ